MRTKLREARLQRNWTLEQAAQHIGCSANALQRWETGVNPPSAYHRDNICRTYNMTVQELELLSEEDLEKQSEHAINREPKGYTKQSTMLSLPDSLEAYEMQSRRKFLQDTLHTACIAFMLSDIKQLVPPPSHADSRVVESLSIITREYWGLFVQNGLNILTALSGHFATITNLFRMPHSSEDLHKQIALAASEVAFLMGKILKAGGDKRLGREYYAFSVRVAREAENYDMVAIGLGHMALSLLYEDARPALALLKEAQSYSRNIQDKRICSWLAAMEAEAHAHLLDLDACQRALDRSRQLSTDYPLVENHYPTEFDTSLQYGYAGACYTTLHQPEKALPVLQQALAELPPNLLKRKNCLLADLSATYAQLGDVAESCKLAHQTLEIVAQTNTPNMLQHIQKKVRQELSPWSNSGDVQALDDHIHQTITFFASPVPVNNF